MGAIAEDEVSWKEEEEEEEGRKEEKESGFFEAEEGVDLFFLVIANSS